LKKVSLPGKSAKRYGPIQGKLGLDAATNLNAAPPGSLAAMAQTPLPGAPGTPPESGFKLSNDDLIQQLSLRERSARSSNPVIRRTIP
jgi:hypothetical protein